MATTVLIISPLPVLSFAEYSWHVYSAANGDYLGQTTDLPDPVFKQYVSLNQIPDFCLESLIQLEDKSFYNNLGIDLSGVARKVVGTVAGRNLGSSTITQQLVKNSSLSSGTDIIAQYANFVTSIRVSVTYSKAYVLEQYINSIYWGDYNYGIAAAAYNYFGKTPPQLSDSECAFLTGMISSPNNYGPMASESAVKANWDRVVARLTQAGLPAAGLLELPQFNITPQSQLPTQVAACLLAKLNQAGINPNQPLTMFVVYSQPEQLTSCSFSLAGVQEGQNLSIP